MAYKAMDAKFDGYCKGCKGAILAGEPIVWESLHKKTFHPHCKPAGAIKPNLVSAAQLAALGMPQTAYPAVNKAAKAQLAKALNALPTPGAVALGPQSKTQKGKGIQVLQQAGLLPKAMAIVCLSEDHAVQAFGTIHGRKFARPCPTQPRHGFVDSREVKSIEDVRALWAETMKADPQGELILMPLVEADYNCVWRPGLLAVGPGHDGATAGNHSITVQLTNEYGDAWKALAKSAGVNLDTQAPFVEAVSHAGIDTVVTQIRAGVRDCPSEPDWVPAPMTVGEVIRIDQALKADSDAMLAWESKAKTLTPGFHIVWDEGGNMGDHWSVHAQLNGIAVVTTFQPQVGQTLGKMGMDLVPLEPQAIIWGFLGGLLSPGLKDASDIGRRNRTRSTVAAIMGTHHGLAMGGEAGVHLGASVALFLRLSQAALWGEARHATSHATGYVSVKGDMTGLSRQQIFAGILDDWMKGRAGLRDRVRCFHLKWAGGFGGPAWAAIGHATVALDKSMIDLVRLPSRVNAKRVMEKLTTAVNLAHNGIAAGCFLNKFCSGEWFDMAAALDPRAACFAGPIWYQATLPEGADRIALLGQIEAMTPIDIGYPAPHGNVLGVKALAKVGAKLKGQTLMQAPHVAKVPTPGIAGGKVGSFGSVALGEVPEGLSGVPVKACAKFHSGQAHMQIAVSAGGYVSGEVNLGEKAQRIMEAAVGLPTMSSMGGTGVTYQTLTVTPEGIYCGSILLLTLTAGAK